MRKSSDRVRITGQLIDAATGAHLWADKFDGRMEDVFDLQDRITASVVGALELTVRKAEIERSRRKPADNLGAYDLYLQALPHIYAIRPDDNRQALDLLMKALELDPDYAPALGHAAWCHVQRITRAWPSYGNDDLAMAETMARNALAVGSDDAIAVVLGGFALTMAGCALVFGDDVESGLPLLERAMELGPQDPNLFSHLTVTAYAHLFAGRPDRALESALRSIALNAEWDSTYWVMITAYMQTGQVSEAEAAAARLLALHPHASASKYGVLPIRNRDKRAMVVESLRKAGVPD